MAQALRAVSGDPMRRLAWWVPTVLFATPLSLALWLGASQALDAAAWSRLIAHSQFAPAWYLSLWVGAASTLLSVAIMLATVSTLHGTPGWQRLRAWLGAWLAVPHAAFAIGVALLFMPSGLVARLIAPLAGWTSPPELASVQDPWGLALIAGLVLKELPFLLWCAAAQTAGVGEGVDLRRQIQVAATMGYASRGAWARVLWPQLLPRLALPMLAVWAYGLTVVDMAIVLGPTRPPTLAVLAWQWLLDGDEAVNRQGAAAALLLTAVVLLSALGVALGARMLRPLLALRWTRGDRRPARPGHAQAGLSFIAAVYRAVVVMLAFMSVTGVWRFPDLLPDAWTLQTWRVVLGSVATLGVTVLLGLLSAATGLALAVTWMETTPAHWDRRAAPLVFAPMLIPGVLLVTGLYQLALHAGLDGSLSGLWLAHSVYATPYALVALAPAYRAYDRRYEQTAHALGRSPADFLLRVKWPMLSAPMAAAFAVGFAVSVTQYLSTQFVGGGRHPTLTTEALTLAAGGQRSLTAAFALLQALLTFTVFAAAGWWGRAQARRLHGEAPA